MLESIGIDPNAPVDPSIMLRDSDYYGFLENIARAEQSGHTLPLRTGDSMRCDDYGLFGLAWKTASNLRASFTRAERYWRVMTSVSVYTVEPTVDGSFVHLHREGARDLGMRLSNEATVASMFTISSEVATQEVKLNGVFFKHAGPEIVADHEAFFGCPVHFNTDRDALLIADESMRAPNRLADSGIAQYFEAQLDAEISQLDAEYSLDKQVKQQIAGALSEGVPNISAIASVLAMSSRTLQRKLSEQGLTYQALVDDARREFAERLLRENKHSLSNIAFLTGFSEQSSFNRAFKRWAGQTPRSYRLAAQSQSTPAH
ncbi:MAG: AraC family transcriptional regulator ligand-binding domain-containing protein [Pseudomonadales bacterium]|nr:AraC family transcriptional regulator ligand-binding domain-containing protein [Pseudomonadales bacterium]